jgi:WD40 repeat protein
MGNTAMENHGIESGQSPPDGPSDPAGAPASDETLADEQLELPLMTKWPPDAAAPASETGHRVRYFGDYELLARGGMGVVYRARQVSLRRVVAVKMILSGHFASRADVQRFLAEAEAAANLDHPNIVPIYEVGTHGGLHYYSMKLIEGGSLASGAPELTRDPRRVAQLVADVARAIHHAHQLGVLHRDLKPANVLLDASGRPMVTDFGLAKRIDVRSDVTQTGSVIGTPSFMAPEQARGEKLITTAADIYSLGAILYSLLAGRPPFVGDSVVQILERVRDAEPERLRRVAPHVDRDLETICLTALQKQPQKRYGSALELAEDLARWLAHEPIRARPAGAVERVGKWARRRPAAAALVCVSFAAAASLLGLWLNLTVRLREQRDYAGEQRNRAVAESNRASEQERLANQRRTEAEGLSFRLAMDRATQAGETAAPQESLLWLARALPLAPDEPSRRLVRLNLDSWYRSIQPLQRVFGEAEPSYTCAVSRDSRVLVTAGGVDFATIRQWDITTGAPVGPVIDAGSLVYSLAISADGAVIVSGCENGTVQRWDSKSGHPIGAPMRHRDVVYAVEFSPDQRTLLTGCQDKQVRLWDVMAGEPARPPRAPMRLSGRVLTAAFSPDGERILAAGASDRSNPDTGGEAREWDAHTGLPLSPSLPSDGESWGAAYSPDGTRFAVSGSSVSEVFDAGDPGKPPVRLVASSNARCVAFSPDGRSILTAGADDLVRTWDSATGSPSDAPVRDSAPIKDIVFLPDGNGFVTVSDRVRLWGRSSSLFYNEMRHGNRLDCLDVSGDGKLVVLTGDGSARLWDISTGQPLGQPMKVQGVVRDIRFSPDGSRVLTCGPSNTAQLWNVPDGSPAAPPITRYRQVADGAFSPDGKLMVIASAEELTLWDAHDGHSIGTLATTTGCGQVFMLRFSPDGGRLLVGAEFGEALFDVARRAPAGPALPTDPNYVGAFSPDGRLAVTGSVGGFVRLFESATGQRSGARLSCPSYITALAYAPNGQTFAAGTVDGNIRLWDAATRLPVYDALPIGSPVTALDYSADSQLLLAGSREGSARLWHVPTGRQIGATVVQSSAIVAAAFIPNSARAITGSFDGLCQPWRVPAPLAGDATRLRLWVETVTGWRQSDSGNPIALSPAEWEQRRQQLQNAGGPPVN